MSRAAFVIRWLFDPKQGPPDRLLPRWLFLRALGLIYFSAFYSLAFQIRGLIGPEGILPANDYLQAVAHSLGHVRGLWFAPTLFWISSGNADVDRRCAGWECWLRCCWFSISGRAGMLVVMLCLLSVVRQRSAGFFRLSI